jgi:hypothetical protein
VKDIFKLNLWQRVGSQIFRLGNDLPSIGWHRNGQELLIENLNGGESRYKLSIVTDKKGKVYVVQVGDKVIDWQK